MRLSAGNSRRYLLVLCSCLFVCLSFFMAGCGGGGDDETPAPQPPPGNGGPVTPEPVITTPVRVNILWGERTRSTVAAPSTALSATITIVGAKAEGGDFRFESGAGQPYVNRPAGGGAINQQYTSTNLAKAGTWLMRVEFYSEANGTGTLVGFAQASVTVKPDGTFEPAIATYGVVRSIEVAPGQTINVGEAKQLIFTAKDADGNIVPLSPTTAAGAVAFVVADAASQGVLGVDPANRDHVVGIAPGFGSVIATLDDPAEDRTSAPQIVEVVSNTALSVTPTNATLSREQSATFTATVANVPQGSDAGVDWGIVEGPAGGTITFPDPANPNVIVYTAPYATGTYNLVATSRYDRKKTQSIVITVNSQVAVNVNPATAVTLSREFSQAFTASVVNVPAGKDQTVDWSIQEGATGGTITTPDPAKPNEIIYTAPFATGTYNLVATSRYDRAKRTVIPITVVSNVAVSVNPTAANISLGQSVQFVASVANVPAGKDAGVNWSIKEGAGGGTITQGGLYTAPNTLGTFTIVATSRYDNSKVAEVQVTVVSKLVVTTNIQTATLSREQTITLTGSVTEDPSGTDQVVWSVPAGGGTITPTTGSSVTYTAPFNEGTYVITAASLRDPSKQVSITITVVSTVTVSVNPTSANLSLEESRVFDATVTNVFRAGGDTTVTWTATGGTLTVDPANANRVTYTAPKAEGTYTLTATSRYDTTKRATVTITVVSRVVVTANPTSASLSWGFTQVFTATVTNPVLGKDASVTWSIQEGEPAGGTLVRNGNTVTYTAPKANGTFRLVATSNYDTTKQVIIPITVVSTVAVTINPAAVTPVGINGVRDLTASVANIPPGGDTTVTWRIVEGPVGGALAPDPADPTNPNKVRYTAPPTRGTGVYTIEATSNYDPSKKTMVNISVTGGSLTINLQ